jgi:H3 lysine-79-specific histone-lysine N-methyltransferase
MHVLVLCVCAAIGKKPPPAPGCVDQQLTSLTLNTNSVHTELDIPPAPADTPYALQILLDMYRAQFVQMVEMMKSSRYRDDVNLQIERDKVRCHFEMFYLPERKQRVV